MMQQLRLDGTPRETKVNLYLDGWERTHDDAEKHGYGMFEIPSGTHDRLTDIIDINLDVCTSAFFGLDCEPEPEQATPKDIDRFAEALARIILHEHVHSVLNSEIDHDTSSAWDNIAQKLGFEFTLETPEEAKPE
jgi:hypothetical protein